MAGTDDDLRLLLNQAAAEEAFLDRVGHVVQLFRGIATGACAWVSLGAVPYGDGHALRRTHDCRSRQPSSGAQPLDRGSESHPR